MKNTETTQMPANYYLLWCHDPVENDNFILYETDDKDKAEKMLQRRREIDGDLYSYWIDEVKLPAPCSIPIKEIPVAAVDCSDDLPF